MVAVQQVVFQGALRLNETIKPYLQYLNVCTIMFKIYSKSERKKCLFLAERLPALSRLAGYSII